MFLGERVGLLCDANRGGTSVGGKTTGSSLATGENWVKVKTWLWGFLRCSWTHWSTSTLSTSNWKQWTCTWSSHFRTSWSTGRRQPQTWWRSQGSSSELSSWGTIHLLQRVKSRRTGRCTSSMRTMRTPWDVLSSSTSSTWASARSPPRTETTCSICNQSGAASQIVLSGIPASF